MRLRQLCLATMLGCVAAGNISAEGWWDSTKQVLDASKDAAVEVIKTPKYSIPAGCATLAGGAAMYFYRHPEKVPNWMRQSGAKLNNAYQSAKGYVDRALPRWAKRRDVQYTAATVAAVAGATVGSYLLDSKKNLFNGYVKNNLDKAGNAIVSLFGFGVQSTNSQQDQQNTNNQQNQSLSNGAPQALQYQHQDTAGGSPIGSIEPITPDQTGQFLSFDAPHQALQYQGAESSQQQSADDDELGEALQSLFQDQEDQSLNNDARQMPQHQHQDTEIGPHQEAPDPITSDQIGQHPPVQEEKERGFIEEIIGSISWL